MRSVRQTGCWLQANDKFGRLLSCATNNAITSSRIMLSTRAVYDDSKRLREPPQLNIKSTYSCNFQSIRMGNGLSLPCEHSGNVTPHHTIKEISSSPGIAELIHSVSDYFRNRTEKERKRAKHSRNDHESHAWLENSPSVGWTDGDRGVPLSPPEETSFPLHDPRPVIYQSVFPTYDHRCDTYHPHLPIHDGPSIPSYRSSSQTYQCQDNSRSTPFYNTYISEPRAPRRGGNSRHNQPAPDCYDVPRPGLSDDNYFYQSRSPPRRRRSRPHRHRRRHAEIPADRGQFRGNETQWRHGAPIRSRPGRSSYRTPSLSALSEEHHDFGTSQDGSTDRFGGRSRRRGSFGGN